MPATIVASYGQSIDSLSQIVTSLDLLSRRELTLSGLNPNTVYYVRIFAKDKSGTAFTSDIFTFKTAQKEALLEVSSSDLTISSNNILLFSQANAVDNQIHSIISTPGRSLTVSIKPQNPDEIASIVAHLQNNRVLGLTAEAAEPNTQQVRLLELLPGVFSGELKTPLEMGTYDIVLEVKSVTGGYSVQTLPQKVYVSNPITILNIQTHKPIEKAPILIKKQTTSKNHYVNLNSALTYTFETDHYGRLNTVLPVGTYEITIKATGYQTKTVQLSVTETKNYPTFLS